MPNLAVNASPVPLFYAAVPCTIGDNVVIGSGCVVTKDIPANCVAVGNLPMLFGQSPMKTSSI